MTPQHADPYRDKKENNMGALGDLLDTLMDAGELYAKSGVKGCALIILAIIVILAGVIALAFWLGQ
jgi:hypothetical protein